MSLHAPIGLLVAFAVAALPYDREDDLARTPYQLIEGPRDAAERSAWRVRLADEALARGDRVRAARHLGVACFWQSLLDGRSDLASVPCKRARELADREQLPDVSSFLELAAGNVELVKQEGSGGYEHFVRAAELCKPIGLDAPACHAGRQGLAFVGVFKAMGMWVGAGVPEIERARALGEQAGDPATVAMADASLCAVLGLTNDFEGASAACARAQQFVDLIGDWYFAMIMDQIQGDRAHDRGEFRRALELYLQSWAMAQRPGGALRHGGLRLAIIGESIQLGELDEAQRWLEESDRELAAGRLPPIFAASMQYEWGRLARARGDWAAAARYFEAGRASPETVLAISARAGLGQARWKLGDQAGARAALEDAIEMIERGRAAVAGPGRAQYQEMNARVYRWLAMMYAVEGTPAGLGRALEVAEAGRARALLDALATASLPGSAAAPLGAAAVQALLAPGEVLVEYVLLDGESWAVTVTRERIAAAPLPGAGELATLAARVGFFRQLVAEGADEATVRPVAARLYADLLAPALAEAPADARTLIISPDGPLHALPFDALWGDGRFVVERWDVALVPSASVLATRATREAPSATALIVAASSAPRLAELPQTRHEAAAAARWLDGEVVELVGGDATLPRLEAARPERFAVLHVASHAVVDEARPFESALALSDAPWRAGQIYGETLGADLVILSACSTGVGQVASGEGVMSLGRAFQHAGAGATVATLWDVDDAVGPAFADGLYRRLARGEALGPAVAGARRALRQGGAPPAAWAAYVLSGPPRGQVRVRARAPGTPVRTTGGLAAAGLALGVLGFGLWRRRWRLVGAGAGIGAVAAGLLLLARPVVRPGPPVPSHAVVQRGAGVELIEARASGGTLAWAAPAQSSSTVRFFTDDGLPAGVVEHAAAPLAIPPGATWWLVEARAGAVLVAASPVSR